MHVYRDKKFESVLKIFNGLKVDKVHLDDVVYSSAIRASYHSRPWNEVIDILDDALSALGEISVLNVLNTALTNLNYGGASKNDLKNSAEIRDKYDDLVDWLQAKSIRPQPKTKVLSN
jgi:hypothetical protein